MESSVSEHRNEDGTSWVPAWTQAMTDFRGEDDQPPFDDVTVRMTVPASIGGTHVRAELSNRFGDEPVRIGRGAIGIGGQFAGIAGNRIRLDARSRPRRGAGPGCPGSTMTYSQPTA